MVNFSISSFSSFATVSQMKPMSFMAQEVLTFNDLPMVVAQLRDEVVSMKKMLQAQQSENKSQAEDKHIPMSVDEAAEYMKMPKGTLYEKLRNGTIPATKPDKRYRLYRDELDKYLESARKNPVPLSDEEINEAIGSSNRRKPKPINW
jgi:excisionase family DNA binding protein